MDDESHPVLSGEGRHVLVVEDDGELRPLLLSLLRRSGFRAAGARNGVEMRAALEGAAVDLVLLDVMLPGRSGFELCREIRAEGPLETLSRRLGIQPAPRRVGDARHKAEQQDDATQARLTSRVWR